MPTPPTAREAFDALGIDAVCDLIREGKSQRDIGASVGASDGSFRAWLNSDPARSARANDARRTTAQHWDEQAERELQTAPLSTEGIARARELASHFRWRASKVDPKNYGDRMEQVVTGDLNLHRVLAEKPMSEDEWAKAHAAEKPDAA